MSTEATRHESVITALIGGIAALVGAAFLFGLTARQFGVDQGVAELVKRAHTNTTFAASDLAWDSAYFAVAALLAAVGVALVAWAVVRHLRAARPVETLPDRAAAVHA